MPPRAQQVALTGACVLGPLCVALPFPTASEKVRGPVTKAGQRRPGRGYQRSLGSGVGEPRLAGKGGHLSVQGERQARPSRPGWPKAFPPLHPAAAASPARLQMFAVTGATAVCAVCYVLPVCIHLRLYLCPGGGGSGSPRRGKARRRGGSMRRSGSRRSFSFEPRLAGSHAAGAAHGGDGPDMRWLLAADHHAGSAALHPLTLAAGALPALQQPRGQQGLQAEGRLGASVEEGAEEGGAGGLLRGHRFTDLSLSRWLHGQSYDSFGNAGDSMPATPMSPDSCQRDGLDCFREALLAGGDAGSLDRQQGWPGGAAASGEESAAAVSEEWEEQHRQEGGLLAVGAGPRAAAAEPAAWPVGALQAVPEASPVVPEWGEERPAGAAGSSIAGTYPCLADAGSGAAAVASMLWHLVLPLAVLLLGLASSASALWLAVAALRTALFRA